MTTILSSYTKAVREMAHIRGCRLKFVKVRMDCVYPFAAEVLVGQRPKIQFPWEIERKLDEIAHNLTSGNALFMAVPIKVVP